MNNIKQLYESIMKSVAVEVKKTLNEYEIYDELNEGKLKNALIGTALGATLLTGNPAHAQASGFTYGIKQQTTHVQTKKNDIILGSNKSNAEPYILNKNGKYILKMPVHYCGKFEGSGFKTYYEVSIKSQNKLPICLTDMSFGDRSNFLDDNYKKGKIRYVDNKAYFYYFNYPSEEIRNYKSDEVSFTFDNKNTLINVLDEFQKIYDATNKMCFNENSINTSNYTYTYNNHTYIIVADHQKLYLCEETDNKKHLYNVAEILMHGGDIFFSKNDIALYKEISNTVIKNLESSDAESINAETKKYNDLLNEYNNELDSLTNLRPSLDIKYNELSALYKNHKHGEKHIKYGNQLLEIHDKITDTDDRIYELKLKILLTEQSIAKIHIKYENRYKKIKQYNDLSYLLFYSFILKYSDL